MAFFGMLQAVWLVLVLHITRKALFYTLLLVMFLGSIVAILCVPPPASPYATMIEVPSGASASAVGRLLSEEGLIYSPQLFKGLARILGVENDIRAGRYYIAKPTSAVELVWRIGHGISGIESVSVTFPEGITIREMGDILHAQLPYFETDVYRLLAKSREGYLFPDTYTFYLDVTPEEVIKRQRERFDEVWKEVQADARAYSPDGSALAPEPQSRIVTMASLLEKETKVGTDRNIVSGILWNRILLDMPLQVDAVFGYIKGVDTFHPSFDDLEVESPYNTYRNRNLPPGPIGNPGKDALEAALMPTYSKYLYYLTGTDGVLHYAETFEEHKQNREQYLR